jgi:putative hydrolases of HD superfamily
MDNFFIELDKTGYTNRWTIVDTNKDQYIDSHQYRVTMIVLYICDKVNEKSLLIREHELLKAALTHDWEEIYTGDIPSNIKDLVDSEKLDKRINKELCPLLKKIRKIKLTKLETLVLKFADKLEAYTFMLKHADKSFHNTDVIRFLGKKVLKMVNELESEIPKVSFHQIINEAAFRV